MSLFLEVEKGPLFPFIVKYEPVLSDSFVAPGYVYPSYFNFNITFPQAMTERYEDKFSEY